MGQREMLEMDLKRIDKTCLAHDVRSTTLLPELRELQRHVGDIARVRVGLRDGDVLHFAVIYLERGVSRLDVVYLYSCHHRGRHTLMFVACGNWPLVPKPATLQSVILRLQQNDARRFLAPETPEPTREPRVYLTAEDIQAMDDLGAAQATLAGDMQTMCCDLKANLLSLGIDVEVRFRSGKGTKYAYLGAHTHVMRMKDSKDSRMFVDLMCIQQLQDDLRYPCPVSIGSSPVTAHNAQSLENMLARVLHERDATLFLISIRRRSQEPTIQEQETK